jgi:homoserine kinase
VSSQPSSVTVRVPATSANLGPGFDSFALALTVYDEVSAQVVPSGLRVDIAGKGSDTLPRDADNLVLASLLAAFDQLGERPSGLALQCRNAIPQARGLGSSAAAIVAGITLADALLGGEALGPADKLALANAVEGHPDNVAACLTGGFSISWLDGATPANVRLHPCESIRPVLFVPDSAALATSQARQLLPTEVPHADAAGNAARAALLAIAMTQRPELLWAATQDRLHQHYRRSAMPDSLALLDRLRLAGVPAVISGAGPSVLALTAEELDEPDEPGWQMLRLSVDLSGATVVSTEP